MWLCFKRDRILLRRIMATLQDLAAGLVDVDGKLDQIIALIAALKASTGLTPEQQAMIDAMNDSILAIKAKEDSALS